MNKKNVRVIIVFRSKHKKGKSIEGIFQSVLDSPANDLELISWEYNDRHSIWWNLWQLIKLNGDIIHITGDIMYLANFLPGQKIVLTYHDIGRFKELKGVKKQAYKKLWIQWPIRKAKKVTTVSEFTKLDLINLVPQCANKIDVVKNGSASVFTFSPKAFNKENPRVLQIGTAHNKNLETVVKAMKGLSAILVVVGPLSDQQHKLIELANIRLENYIDLETIELQKQYALCDILTFISLHEGFGMPIIEAQHTGRAVIVSSLASIPEIAGNGAHYIKDPLDSNEIRESIQQIIDNDDYRESLILAGQKNADRFSIEKMRKEYFQVYRQTANP